MKYIMLHGLGQKADDWRAVQEYLNVCVECPELAEFMEKSADYSKLYDEFSRYLNTYDEPLNLCGLSLGGILAMDYVRHFPEKVSSVVLIGTPYEIPKLLFGLQNIVFHIMPKKSFDEIGLSKKSVIELTSSMKRLNIPKMAEKISCRTLIACGEKDNANRKSAKQLHGAIAESSLKVIGAASHEVNNDNPAELAAVLNEFWKNNVR